MTKTTNDQNKSRKVGKQTNDSKLMTNDGPPMDDLESTLNCKTSEEDSTSSILTDEDQEEFEGGSSGDDTDQAMAKALDTVLHQATEAKVVVPPTPTGAPKNDSVTVPGQPNSDEEVAGLVDAVDVNVPLSASPPKLANPAKRKIQVERRKVKNAHKLSKERRERIKARVARQVAELALVDEEILARAAPPVATAPQIPKLSVARVRQQKAVQQARNRMGLSTRYGNLANLVEFHRTLLKGNPFALIEPKQVYPYFHLVPGINLPQIQPLVRAWQEKATRLLYQLLLIETTNEIARIKKRSTLLKLKPAMFKDALLLKVDIGLECSTSEEALPVSGSVPSAEKSTPLTNNQRLNQAIDVGQPPSKKIKKVTAAVPI